MRVRGVTKNAADEYEIDVASAADTWTHANDRAPDTLIVSGATGETARSINGIYDRGIPEYVSAIHCSMSQYTRRAEKGESAPQVTALVLAQVNLPHVPSLLPLVIGADVEAKNTEGKWWPVVIKGINRDGTFDVEVQDGHLKQNKRNTQWVHMPRKNIRAKRATDEEAASAGDSAKTPNTMLWSMVTFKASTVTKNSGRLVTGGRELAYMNEAVATGTLPHEAPSYPIGGWRTPNGKSLPLVIRGATGEEADGRGGSR